MKSKRNVYIQILSLVNGLIILFLFKRAIILIYIAVFIALLSLLIPRIALFLGVLLEKILHILGGFINVFFLGIVYMLFLTPLALLYRVFSKKNREMKKPVNSFFSTHSHLYSEKDFTNQW